MTADSVISSQKHHFFQTIVEKDSHNVDFNLSYRKKRSTSDCHWIAVGEKEGDQPVEFSLNSNGTVKLSLLHQYFPGVTGLTYLNKATNRSRIVDCDEDTCTPGLKPCSHTYVVTRERPATIHVAEKEGDDLHGFRINDDGSISLKTISSVFPGTIGLRYRDPVSKIITSLPCENMTCHLKYTDLPKTPRTYIALKINEGIFWT